MCWGCFVALFPDKAKLKVRKEQYVLAELERLVPELGAYETTWDCAVPGGCSVKQPDKLYKLSDRYLHLEVDEFGHVDKACVDEDTRLELIAADVGLPGLVLRLDPDDPPTDSFATASECMKGSKVLLTAFWRKQPTKCAVF